MASVTQPSMELVVILEDVSLSGVHVFTALRSSVDVCRRNKMYTPTIVFVHNEIVCYPTTKHTFSLCTKTK